MATAAIEDILHGISLGQLNATYDQDEKARCEGSLKEFISCGWESLEPAQTFVSGWAVDAVCDHLEAVTSGDIRRLLINVPPGCMKSMSTCVFWPMWEWGPKDLANHRFINCSYEKDLSIRDNVRSRDLAQSEWYQKHWSARWDFKEDVNLKIRYENTKRGWRQASSTGAGLTGHRGDRIILDDPHAVRDVESEAIREDALRWFSETLPTRLNNQATSAIIVIMQRVHERDVSGLILAEELNYEHLCLPMEYEAPTRSFTSVKRKDRKAQRVCRLKKESEPLPRYLTKAELAAEEGLPEDFVPKWKMLTCQDRRETKPEGTLLWPERFPADSIEDLKAAFRAWGGTYAEAGQLQQRPAPREGGMFQKGDFQLIEALPTDIFAVCRGWDLASSTEDRSPYTVGLQMGLCRSGAIVIMDVWREQATPLKVEQAIERYANNDKVTRPGSEQSLPQDPGQAGKSQKHYLSRERLQGANFHFSPESGSKEDRARPLSAQCEAGNVYVLRAPWTDALINEFCLFPNGQFKDQVDAGSRSYMRLATKKPQKIATGGPIVVAAAGGISVG